MKNKLFAALFAFAFSLSASAGVLFDNGAATTHNGYGIGQGSSVADNFTIEAGATIHSFGFYFQNYNGVTGWDQHINYRILSDVAGDPGVELTVGAGQFVSATESAYDWCCGGKAWLVEFNLASDFVAAAGPTYWLELSGAGGPSPWWVTAGFGDGIVSESYRSDENFAFMLSGGAVATDVAPVPEPSSIALVGLGLAGFAAARRRKSSK